MGKFETTGDLRVEVQVDEGEFEVAPPSPGATLQDLIISINELRHEISHAKYNNNDWWHSTLKRLDKQDRKLARLTGLMIGFGWLVFLLTAGVVGLAVFSGSLQWPTWEEFSQLWAWAR